MKENAFKDEVNVFYDNLDRVYKHIDWHLANYPSLTLSGFGGEPLVYADVFGEVIQRYVRNPKVRFNFITNGELLPKTWDIFKQIPYSRLGLSISYDYSLQDETRKAGTYETIREVIKEYCGKAQGFKTVTVFTADTLPRIGEAFDDYLALVQKCPRQFVARVNLSKNSFKDREDIYTNEGLIQELTRIRAYNQVHSKTGMKCNSLMLSRKNFDSYRQFLNGCYAICPDGRVTWDCNSFFKGWIDNLYAGTIFQEPDEVYEARQKVLEQWGGHIDEKCIQCSAQACKCPPFYSYEAESPVHWGSVPKPEKGYYCEATKFISKYLYG